MYYGIGKYLSANTRKKVWGTGALEAISSQLQEEMPGLRGFSVSGLRKMRLFYEQWQFLDNTDFVGSDHGNIEKRSPAVNDLVSGIDRSPAVNDLAGERDHVQTETLLFKTKLVGDLDINDFLALSFSHHYEIIAKTDNLEERAFYIRQAARQRWSKEHLIEELKADLYHHQGALPNNFVRTLSPKSKALQAVEMFKDNYLLDFVNIEELGARDRKDVDERVLEQSIIQNIKEFIMTFGKDFTFVGNQYHLEKFGEELFPDLLFFNRELAALVVVELKFGDFKPAYLGQLSAYLRVLDDEVRKPYENPSIGIVLCRSANKSFVEYLIQDYRNPMGVATYQTKSQIKELLPPEEELKKLLTENPGM